MRGLFPLVPKSQQLSVTLGAQGLWELFTLYQSSTITKSAQTCPQTPGAEKQQHKPVWSQQH